MQEISCLYFPLVNINMVIALQKQIMEYLDVLEVFIYLIIYPLYQQGTLKSVFNHAEIGRKVRTDF